MVVISHADEPALPMTQAQLGRPYANPSPAKQSVALSETHLAVWSWPQGYYGGAVHLFERLGRGRLSAPIELISPAATSTSTSAVSLAMDDRQLIIAEANVTNQLSGAVFVYDLTSPNAPIQCQTLYDPEFTPQVPADSLCLVGDDLFISSIDVNAVVQWRRDGEGFWRRLGKIVPPGTPTSSWKFGTSIACDGTTLVIGAPGEATRGTVYTYERVKDDTWELVQKISSPTTSSLFGTSVAVSGEQLVIGAPSGLGAAFVSRRIPGGWSALESLPSASVVNNARAGTSVALYGSRVLVGIPGAVSVPAATSIFTGGIASYTFDGSAWTFEGMSTWPAVPSSPATGSGFSQPGTVLAIHGPDLATTPSLVFSLDPLSCPEADTDDDGIPDCADEDIDGDLILNTDDGCPFDHERGDPHACGCGNPVVDSDADGQPDCLDANDDADVQSDASDRCRVNSLKIAPDRCGCEGGVASGAPTLSLDPCPAIPIGHGDLLPIPRRENSFSQDIDDLAADGDRIAFGTLYEQCNGSTYPCGGVSIAHRGADGRCVEEQFISGASGRCVALKDDLLFATGLIYQYGSYGGWRLQTSQTSASDAITADIDGGRILVNSTFPRLLYRNAVGTWTVSNAPPLESTQWGGTALRGDLAFIGSPMERNVVHVYRIVSPTEPWQLVQTIASPFNLQPASGSPYFGVSLAVDGDWLFVGADSASSSKGVVVIYRRNSAGFWEFTQILAAQGFIPDHFGSRIDARHGTLAVPFSQNTMSARYGMALYQEENGFWQQVALVTSPIPTGAHWGNVAIGDGFVAMDCHRSSTMTSSASAVRVYALDPHDADHDGVADLDSDGDGVCDAYDRCPGAPDVDTDGDGFLDCDDPNPTLSQPNDADFDGVPAPLDACDTNPNKTAPGQCGCTVADSDFDGDGVADCLDEDDDNDGLPDSAEFGACDFAPPIDSDGDGQPDCSDYDDDNDGIQDVNDRCPGEADGPPTNVGVPVCQRLDLPVVEIASPDGIAGDRFGAGLAIDGDRLAIGEPGRNRVSIFEFTKSGWQRAGVVEPAGAATTYGFSVALRGDVLVIGDPSARAVEVRVRDAQGVWNLSRRIDDADFGQLHTLGRSVAIGDGFFIASAPLATRNGISAGVVVFGRLDHAGTISQLQLIDHPAPRSAGGLWFGTSITTRGNRFAISARYSSTMPLYDEGCVTLWEAPTDQATAPPQYLGIALPKLVSGSNEPTRQLGTHLALDPFGGMLASSTRDPSLLYYGRFAAGFAPAPDGSWMQIWDGDSVYPSSGSGSETYSFGFDTSGNLHVATWLRGNGATRVERMTSIGRSELVGFLPIDASTGTASNFGDTVAISGTLVASGSPDITVDGLPASGLVRIFDLCGIDGGSGEVDCNNNGIRDGCELATGAAVDTDEDLLIDACERAKGDLNLDGEVDAADLSIVLVAWGTMEPSADATGDGVVDAADLSRVLVNWGTLP